MLAQLKVVGAAGLNFTKRSTPSQIKPIKQRD